MTTTVSQEAREAAADMQRWRAHDKPTGAEDAMRDGLLDDNYTVQAFAKFEQSIRHQAERETLARMEPVAWMYERKGFAPAVSMRDPRLRYSDIEALHPLYTLPPAPEAGQ